MKILITGSSRGIGRALVKNFTNEENNHVIGISRTNDLVISNYTYLRCDLAKIKEVEKLSSILKKQHSDLNLFILNAGIGIFCELEQFNDSQIINMFNVNIISQIIILKHILPQLRKQKNARIIIIGSEAGLYGAKKSAIYSATKFALRGFAKSLRFELAKDAIPVTIINPGMILSNFYDKLNFEPGENYHNKIELENMVSLINNITYCDNNMVLDEINISPMKKVVKFKNEMK
jgi:3-hydroxy acid dehydrogenase/malonic semialdehyde reductase